MLFQLDARNSNTTSESTLVSVLLKRQAIWGQISMVRLRQDGLLWAHLEYSERPKIARGKHSHDSGRPLVIFDFPCASNL